MEVGSATRDVYGAGGARRGRGGEGGADGGSGAFCDGTKLSSENGKPAPKKCDRNSVLPTRYDER